MGRFLEMFLFRFFFYRCGIKCLGDDMNFFKLRVTYINIDLDVLIIFILVFLEFKFFRVILFLI